MKQIYPATITGQSFAPGGSVLDHAFGKSEPYTLGVEEEYMLLDGETFDLVQHIDSVLAAVSGHELEARINAELMQSVLEIATPVCRTPADVEEQLRKIRTFVCDVARSDGLRVGSAGTHPFSLSGPPPRFKDYSDYASVVGQLEKTGCIADYTHIWWDIRLHPRLGTVEIRICDATTRLEDVVALTAYCQALVKHYCEQHERGETIPSYHRILTTENKWLAARYGLEAPLMDLASGRRNRVPVSQLIRRTLKEIEPQARELGCDRELAGVRDILARGNGSDRQLRIFNANRDIVEVVEGIAEAT